MTRFKSILRLLVVLGILLVALANQLWALPNCSTYCSCAPNVSCTDQCVAIPGIVVTCGDWGICPINSCYCGGQC